MDWKSKFTSRKWWSSVIGVVVSVMVLFNVDSTQAERITSLITAVSAAVAYTISEGFVDAAAVNTLKSKEESEEKSHE